LHSNGRSAAVSRYSNLATAHWRGAPLDQVVKESVRPFKTDGVGAIDISGAPMQLPANAVITLSLMLHELATNAAKYGSLSTLTGKFSITWQMHQLDN